MAPLDAASTVLILGPAVGMAAAAAYAVGARGRSPALSPRTAMARAASYAGLAFLMLVAARAGLAGIAVFLGALGTIGVLEWARLYDLPTHHRVALLFANGAIIVAIAVGGAGAADWLVGGLVLVGAVWPVFRADTGRAVRDLGMAAVGLILITVLLAHGVALAAEHGDRGIALVVAVAMSCQFSDVFAYIFGTRLGRTPLAPRLSPNKTVEGAVGNFVGAATGVLLFAPAVVPAFGIPFAVALVALVAGGAVWGDLLESAAKREAGVKDAGAWLPGFGGILDRMDSMLVTIALVYWLCRIAGGLG